MQRADEPRIEHGLGREELGRVAALEAHTRLDGRLGDRLLHRQDFPPLDRERLFNDHVLAVARGRDELRRVLIRIAGDVDDMD
jgi:hypothetical protein